LRPARTVIVVERILVTGSAGHLGEALVRVLSGQGRDVVGMDVKPSPFTSVVGSITDRATVRAALDGVTAVLHPATLHKPHVGSHSMQDFVDTNVTGTLTLLEESVAAGVAGFVFTSTTSAFGRALSGWITEDVVPVPKNIYGVTKVAAENLCELVHRDHGLPVVVLRTSRFFPEADDRDEVRDAYEDANLKANEYLYRRADIQDIVDAHLLALEKAPVIGFDRMIVSATTPFRPDDVAALHGSAPSVVAELFPAQAALYADRGWRMFDEIDRVYVNDRARSVLGWRPRYDFAYVLDCLRDGVDFRSPLALQVGAKGYHDVPTGVYTVR
jgi:UDP-glucose 4-epimerase